MTDQPDARAIAEEYVNTGKAGRDQLRAQHAGNDDFWAEVQRHVAGLITQSVRTARPSTDY